MSVGICVDLYQALNGLRALRLAQAMRGRHGWLVAISHMLRHLALQWPISQC